MLRKILITLVLFGTLAVLPSCGATTPAPPPTPEPTSTSSLTGTITLADISDEPAKKIERFQPLADYLAARLGDFGIGVGQVKIAPDMETMVEWLANGEVDLYFDSLYPAMIVSDQSGAEPILRRWKSGVADYSSIVFVLADSGITSLEDLQGKMIALEDPLSTSGYMLPLAYIIEAGLNPVEKGDTDSTVAEDEIGYIFSGEDENVVQWVISGRVVAGVLDDENFADIPEETRAHLSILMETERVARQVAIIRPDMDSELREAIIDILLEMDESEEGREVLEKFKKTAKFDEFPEGVGAALERMRVLYELVQQHK